MLILNLTRGRSKWRIPLSLPATPGEVAEAYSQLDQISEKERSTRIASVISEVSFFDGFFRDKYPDSFDELNELAQRLEKMNDQELRTLDGALNGESVSSVTDILRIADNLKDYIFINGVTTEKELGRFLVDTGYKGFPEKVRPYLDYAAIGAEYCAERGGAFTALGFTLRRRDMESLSPKETEWWKPIFRAYLQTPAWQSKSSKPYALDLPATSEQICAAQNELEVPDLEESELLRAECQFISLEPYIPLEEPDFAQLRDLSVILSASMDDYGKSLVLAVYEMKRPQNLTQACELSQEIWR